MDLYWCSQNPRAHTLVLNAEDPVLRVGIIDSAITLCLFHGLTENIISHNCSLTVGKPADINQAFSQGDLDIASISATYFLEHRLEYILLSDLGIGATEEIIGMRIYSKKTPSELDQKTLYIPPKSVSSVKLLKALCKHFWKVTPSFLPYFGKTDDLFHQDSPFLITGDEGLSFFEKYPLYTSIDLANTWHNLTKKSSLFSVVASRNDAFLNQPHEVIDFQKCLEKSFSWSQNNMEEILAEAARRTGCSVQLLQKFFSAVEHQLTPKHFNGLDYLSTL